jgi:exopolyphosphatase / guanosine-5'-triphosphate,3'-diphosphate pyrophosphatase
MSEQKGRIAVIDLGSNSLRLAVFARLGGTLLPLVNEKVMCGLGRGIAATGRLNPEGKELAFANLPRFVALARALEVEHLAVIATSAVRDAADGRSFAIEIERLCRIKVDIIDGAAEGRLSARGVLAGIPEAEGIVADLGGGSVELVRVARPAETGGGKIGEARSLPIGPLRLAPLGSSKAAAEKVEEALSSAAMLCEGRGRTLYLVGGAWRAVARLHMEQARYPLHIIHAYTLARRDALSFLEIVWRQSRKSLDRIRTISKKRLEVVPLAALILERLIHCILPQQIAFSAFGLREGYASSFLGEEEGGTDPLIAAVQAIGPRQSRFRLDGDRLEEWTAPLFPYLPGSRRLHRAACWLSDIAWSEHPDYRAEMAFTRALTMPLPALDHAERVFIACVLHARYGGSPEAEVLEATRLLIHDGRMIEARRLGLALRLAYGLSEGATDLLTGVWLLLEEGRLVLEVPASGSLYRGEIVTRRFEALARALGAEAKLRPRASMLAVAG